MAVKRGKRLKPLSRDNRFKRIRNCKCYQDMKDRMLAGWPLDQLVKFIQVDSGELKDLKPASLVTMLRDFRDSIPKTEFVSLTPPSDLVEQRMRPYHEAAINAVSEGIDELKELEKLYKRQIERIEIDTEVEKRQKKLIPSMTQEIRVAKELLDASAKLKMDLGMNKRHLGLMETEARLIQDVGGKYGNEAVIEALEDSQTRQRLAGVVANMERLLLSEGTSDPDEAGSLLDELASVLPDEDDVARQAVEEEFEESEDYEYPEHPGYRSEMSE